MARPADEIAADATARSRLRASSADREQVIDVLKAAFVQGRLAKDEFDLRVSQVLASRTYADLAVLTADIPAGLTRAQPPEPARESNDKKALGLGRRIDVMAGLAVVAASIVTAIVIHRPVIYCSYLGNGPPPPGCITSDYSMTPRVLIVIAGFIVAGLIITIGRYAHRRRG
jgi:Domain of unknown function (DUF1707)